MNKKRYHIIQAVHLHDLENFVNEHISNGWYPLGAPQILRGENGIVYNQAMIYDTPIIVNQVLSDKDRDEIIAHAISTRMMQR